MTKQEIIQQLENRYADFRDLIGGFEEQAYLAAPEGKWNAGQQLEHIYRAVLPVNLAFGLPAFVPRLLFGKSRRPSRTYEELVEKYKTRLAAGGRASGPYIPGKARWENRQKWLRKLEKQVSALCRKAGQVPENQLDTLLLPHPLLGKLTLREMLYFTLYHVQHHQNAILNNLR